MLKNVEIKQDKCNANVFYQIFKHQQSHLDCNWASFVRHQKTISIGLDLNMSFHRYVRTKIAKTKQ
jgi:ribosome-binding factor A